MIVSIDKFVEAMLTERLSAVRKFPTNKFQLPALMEEVGEVAQAIMECQKDDHQRFGTRCRNNAVIHVYEEAVQVASMAMRLATEGDLDFPAYIPVIGERSYEWQYPAHGDTMSVVEL